VERATRKKYLRAALSHYGNEILDRGPGARGIQNPVEGLCTSITGATGHTGHIIAKTLLKNGKRVRGNRGRTAERLQPLVAEGAEGLQSGDMVDKTELVAGVCRSRSRLRHAALRTP